MRHSPSILLLGAALLVAVPFTLIHAADTTSTLSPMTNEIPTGFSHHLIKTAGRDILTSRILLHQDYTVAQLPEEPIDLSNPKLNLPLVVAIKPTGPCVISVAARPAYDDGAVAQWLEFMISAEGYDHGPITKTQVGPYPAVMCDARQVADGMVMQMRFIMLEDGGRIVILNAMAPAEFWAVSEEKLMAMLRSFEFQVDHGTKVALLPGEAPPAGAPAPVASSEPPAAPTAAVARVAETSATPTAKLTSEEFAALVLAEDATSLDQDAGINANFRDRGVGLVPRVLSVDAGEKSARLGAGAIEGILRVPFGWYVSDDGRRTLVFDGEGKMQISLNLRPHEGRPLVEIARALIAPYLEREPDLPVAVLEFDGGIAGAGVRGANIDGETLDQVFLVRAAGRDDLVVVARVTGAGEDSIRALNLAGDILARLETARELIAQN